MLSYYNAYKLPTVVIRTFNTYGPFQKTGGEGGVVAIFINNLVNGRDINIYGTGEQIRDLLYVKDCDRFVIMPGYSNKVNGLVEDADTVRDVTINELTKIITKNRVNVTHAKHIYPQSEIIKLKCNYKKVKKLL